MELSTCCVPGFEMLIALARQRLPPIGFSCLLNKIVPWKGEHWVSASPSVFFYDLRMGVFCH